jgi:hypothetical protein
MKACAQVWGGGGVDPHVLWNVSKKSVPKPEWDKKKSVRLKSERHHFVLKKRNRWTFWKWKLPKNNKNAYTNQEINHIILAANNQLSRCNSSANVMRCPRGAVKRRIVNLVGQTESLKLWKVEVQLRSQEGGSGRPAMGGRTALVKSWKPAEIVGWVRCVNNDTHLFCLPIKVVVLPI